MVWPFDGGPWQTSQSLMSGLESALGVRATIDDDVIEALETELLMADVGVATTQVIMDRLIAAHPRNTAVDTEAVMTTLKRSLSRRWRLMLLIFKNPTRVHWLS